MDSHHLHATTRNKANSFLQMARRTDTTSASRGKRMSPLFAVFATVVCAVITIGVVSAESCVVRRDDWFWANAGAGRTLSIGARGQYEETTVFAHLLASILRDGLGYG
eukprot:Opistho-2@66989